LSFDIQNNSNSNPINGDLKSFLLTNNSKQKLDFEYGKKIAISINGQIRGTSSYFFNRNARFRKNRLMANGRMDIKTMFQDRMEMNGKVNYANISWKAPAIISTTISRIIGSWMRRKEKIQVTAIDPTSLTAKKDAADQAEFVYDNKEMLMQLQQEANVPIVGQDQFVAEDKDELDAWVSEFNRLPEEIKYEIGVNNIFEINGWTGVLKEKALKDSAEAGLLATYTWMDEEGIVHIEWIKPEIKKTRQPEDSKPTTTEYKFESKSEPGSFYVVQVTGDKVKCNCAGQYRAKDRQCKHMKEVRQKLGL